MVNKITLSPQVYAFFENSLYLIDDFQKANKKVYSVCGIKDFFPSKDDFLKVKERIKSNQNLVKEDSRIEYGDFQTPTSLAELIVKKILGNNELPNVILEPTCGKGTFVLAVLKQINAFARYYCIEIYKPYIWISKFSIFEYFLENPDKIIPHIEFIHQNIFDINFNDIVEINNNDYLLILGNPPWVTNSQLGLLNSDNLPKKSNFKGHNGFDAITGKGNFDIAEYICLMLFNSFSNTEGIFAFLVKNIVIKNLINGQFQNNYRISNLIQFGIDAKKEFNVSADASLFFCKLNNNPSFQCLRTSIYSEDYNSNNYFGFVGEKFVSNVKSYDEYKNYDGNSQIIWRSGVKHDCSKIMELELVNGHYINQLDEKLILENEIIYGLLKSSDLKNTVIDSANKYTIITQKRIGEDTSYLEKWFPNIYSYLINHKEYFTARKSKIYNDKPEFSIFGIGDYSFTKYKIAISGLYKQTKFSLLLPFKNKSMMVDDTCYFIGFDYLPDAVIILLALNHKSTQEFLNSLIFYDTKRIITKDILMRIDLIEILNNIPYNYFEESIRMDYSNYCEPITKSKFENTIKNISPKNVIKLQEELF